MILETDLNCPICRNRSKEISKIKTINKNSDIELKLLECLECKHWFHDKSPSQKVLEELYSKNDSFVTGEFFHNTQTYPNEVIERYTLPILKEIEIKNFNYLELGSGAGHLLNFFSKTANFSIGIEPSPPRDSKNTVKSIKLLPEGIQYDIIICQDVIEHLKDPIKTLRILRKYASKDCLIYIGIPNKSCLKAKLLKEKWSMIRPFGHLHYFSKKSIRNCLTNSGFEVVRINSVRAGKSSPIDLIKSFDYKSNKLIFRLIKSLILGQLIMGKDQFYVTAKAK